MENAVNNNPEEKDQGGSTLKNIEAVMFPLLAGIIGVGYTAAILINNPLGRVLHSPHAIILIVIFMSIAYFPLKSLLRQITKSGGEDK